MLTIYFTPKLSYIKYLIIIIFCIINTYCKQKTEKKIESFNKVSRKDIFAGKDLNNTAIDSVISFINKPDIFLSISNYQDSIKKHFFKDIIGIVYIKVLKFSKLNKEIYIYGIQYNISKFITSSPSIAIKINGKPAFIYYKPLGQMEKQDFTKQFFDIVNPYLAPPTIILYGDYYEVKIEEKDGDLKVSYGYFPEIDDYFPKNIIEFVKYPEGPK